jgi:ABC-type dipeptide/oligopeptide/nickel transport system permease subunit
MKYKSDIFTRVDYSNRFKILKKLFIPFLIGVVFLIVACFLKEENGRNLIAFLGAILALPCFIYSYILTILHWKERYTGDKSTLWGILLLVETSGWFKLVYIFRHLLPDLRSRGRYKTHRTSHHTQALSRSALQD